MPAINPMAAGNHAATVADLAASSMAGISNDQTEAATMTPEAKPSSVFCNLKAALSPTNNTDDAPNAVPRKGNVRIIIRYSIRLYYFAGGETISV